MTLSQLPHLLPQTCVPQGTPHIGMVVTSWKMLPRLSRLGRMPRMLVSVKADILHQSRLSQKIQHLVLLWKPRISLTCGLVWGWGRLVHLAIAFILRYTIYDWSGWSAYNNYCMFLIAAKQYYSLLSKCSLHFDVTMVEQIQVCRQNQYKNCIASVGSNHCFHVVGT